MNEEQEIKDKLAELEKQAELSIINQSQKEKDDILRKKIITGMFKELTGKDMTDEQFLEYREFFKNPPHVGEFDGIPTFNIKDYIKIVKEREKSL